MKFLLVDARSFYVVFVIFFFFFFCFFFNVPPSEGVICNISMNRRGFRLLVLIALLRSIF